MISGLVAAGVGAGLLYFLREREDVVVLQQSCELGEDCLLETMVEGLVRIYSPEGRISTGKPTFYESPGHICLHEVAPHLRAKSRGNREFLIIGPVEKEEGKTIAVLYFNSPS